jgi:hypothetical protein
MDSDGKNILANRYDKIDFLCEKSMLNVFLSGTLNAEKSITQSTLIYPFGFNISQKAAVDNALSKPLSIIEGPPGTGKTQTILNIIANAVMKGESVAVVSSNNSATANVYEKLEKYDIGFIAAYLGNSDNKTKFIESQKPLPDMSAWKLSAEHKASISKALQTLHGALNSMLEKKNKLSKVRQEFETIKLEYRHFCEYFPYNDEQSSQCLKPNITSTTAMELWIACEKYSSRGKMPGLLERFINRILFGALNRTLYRHLRVINRIFYSADPEKIIALCQKHR